MKNVLRIERDNRRFNIYDIIFSLAICCGTIWLYMNYAHLLTIAGDTGDGAYAIFAGTAKTLQQGEMPLWFPYLWGGFSGVGHAVTQSLYPITLLLCKIFYNSDMGYLSYSIIIWIDIIHIIILCLSYYVLFRVLNFRQFTSAAIAISATFNCAMLGRRWIYIFTGMVWLPLILSFAVLFFKNRGKKSWGYAALTGLILGLSGLANQAQSLLINIMFFGFLFLFYLFGYHKDKKEVFRIIKQFILAIFIGISICAPSLFSAIQYSINASRFAGGAWLRGLDKVSFDLFIENKMGSENLNGIFLGAGSSAWFSIGIFFSIFLISSFYIKNIHNNKPVFHFAQFTALFALLYSMAIGFPYILYHIPFYSGIREPFLYAPYACMMAAILAAYGLDYILDALNNFSNEMKVFDRMKELYYNVPCLIIVLIIFSVLLLLSSKINIIRICILFCITIFFITVWRSLLKSKKEGGDGYYSKVFKVIIYSVLIIGIGFDVLGYTQFIKTGAFTVAEATEKVNMVNESMEKMIEKYHPTKDNPYRICSWGDTAYPSNIAATLGSYDIFGYLNPINTKMVGIHGLDLRKRAQLQNIKYVIHSDKADESFVNWFNEVYKFRIIDTVEGIYRTYDDQEPSTETVYTTDTDQGAAWLVNDVIEYSNKDSSEKILEMLANPEVDLSKTALVNIDTVKDNDVSFQNISESDNTTNSTIVIEEYNVNSMKMHLNLNKAALLVTADAYYPGWKVYVDGKNEPLVEVNYAFRGVTLEAGAHIVEFNYVPMTFVGGIISFLLALLISLYLIVSKLFIKSVNEEERRNHFA